MNLSDLPWEDYLLERKTESDLKDLLKTLVAFANSVRPGHVAEILIGEKNDGSIEGVCNVDNIQKRVRKTCEKIYPPILWSQEVYVKEGRNCVRVKIEYDGDTPHFGDIAWVRHGSETIKAPDEVFQKLIELRLSKVRKLTEWINKEIAVVSYSGEVISQPFGSTGIIQKPWGKIKEKAILLKVNNFWMEYKSNLNERKYSEPLEKILLSWDNDNNCPKILVKP